MADRNGHLDKLVLSGALKAYAYTNSAVNDGTYGVELAERLVLTFPSGETLTVEANTNWGNGCDATLTIV